MIHPETLAELGLETGDPVAVSDGHTTIGCYAFPTDEWPVRDATTDEIHIDFSSFLVGSDAEPDTVSVRPVSPSPARRIVLEGVPDRAAPQIHALLSRETLIGALAVEGTRLFTHSKNRADRDGIPAGYAYMPEVYDTVPDGIVVLAEGTTIETR